MTVVFRVGDVLRARERVRARARSGVLEALSSACCCLDGVVGIGMEGVLMSLTAALLSVAGVDSPTSSSRTERGLLLVPASGGGI